MDRSRFDPLLGSLYFFFFTTKNLFFIFYFLFFITKNLFYFLFLFFIFYFLQLGIPRNLLSPLYF